MYYLAYMYKYRYKTVDLTYLKIFHDLFKFILDKEISHLKRLKLLFMAATPALVPEDWKLAHH